MTLVSGNSVRNLKNEKSYRQGQQRASCHGRRLSSPAVRSQSTASESVTDGSDGPSDIFDSSEFTASEASDLSYRPPRTRKKRRPFLIKDKLRHVFEKGTRLIASYKEANSDRPEGWYAHQTMNGAKILLPAIFHHGPHLWSLEHPDRAITMFRKTRNSSGVVVEHIPAPSDRNSRGTAHENAQSMAGDGRVAAELRHGEWPTQ